MLLNERSSCFPGILLECAGYCQIFHITTSPSYPPCPPPGQGMATLPWRQAVLPREERDVSSPRSMNIPTTQPTKSSPTLLNRLKTRKQVESYKGVLASWTINHNDITPFWYWTPARSESNKNVFICIAYKINTTTQRILYPIYI